MHSTSDSLPDRLSRSPSRDVGQLVRFNQHAQPIARLFCFPYAGGDANIFRSWVNGVPNGVEVIGVQYPGRGIHNGSGAISSCDEMVSLLRSAMLPWLDRDFAFFGHSNGALISFELARALAPEQRKLQRHHFLSARVAAHVSSGRKRIGALPFADFIREVRAIGGTPQELLDDQQLMRVLAPQLRAEFALGENYQFKPGPLLACEITTLQGTNDCVVNGALVERWTELTTGRAQHHVVDGDHFFLGSRQENVLSIVRSRLHEIIVGHSRHPCTHC